MSDDRDGISICAVVRDDENTEQRMEDIEEQSGLFALRSLAQFHSGKVPLMRLQLEPSLAWQ